MSDTAPHQTFYLKVAGKNVVAKYYPNWPSGKEMLITVAPGKPAFRHAAQHWEFRHKGCGPIGETGFRSHFINGTRRQLHITDKNIRDITVKLAEALAAEFIPPKPAKAVKRRRRHATKKR